MGKIWPKLIQILFDQYGLLNEFDPFFVSQGTTLYLFQRIPTWSQLLLLQRLETRGRFLQVFDIVKYWIQYLAFHILKSFWIFSSTNVIIDGKFSRRHHVKKSSHDCKNKNFEEDKSSNQVIVANCSTFDYHSIDVL